MAGWGACRWPTAACHPAFCRPPHTALPPVAAAHPPQTHPSPHSSFAFGFICPPLWVLGSVLPAFDACRGRGAATFTSPRSLLGWCLNLTFGLVALSLAIAGLAIVEGMKGGRLVDAGPGQRWP